MTTEKELQTEIKRLKKQVEKLKKSVKKKKYGLVWMNVPEAFEDDVENKLPILKEVPEKAIINDDGKPTHILIEGDNYHALTCLNYTHKGKVDIIYIDPPYNTGTDKFKYKDKRIISEFPDGTEVKKDHPFRHSYWLSFIYKRIRLCKALLSRDGVIFISIDDNEYAQMKILMDEVFGETNYVASLVWEKKKKGSHLNDFVTNVKEYVLVYCKDSRYFEGLVAQVTSHRETYPCVNPGNARDIRKIPSGIKSNYREKDFHLPSGSVISSGNMELKLISDLNIKNGILANELIIEGEWRYTQDNMTKLATKGSLYLTRDLYIRRIVEEPRGKKLKDLLPRVDYNFLIELKDKLILEYEKEIRDDKAIDKIKSEIENVESGIHVIYDPSNLYVGGWGSNEDADVEQRDLFGEKVFDYPKPLQLLKKLINTIRKKNVTVLDFFAGTGTTGHAVLELNEMDGIHREFILCTNNEAEGQHHIASKICYPRLCKAIKGYQLRNGKNRRPLGGSLKYYKTDFIGKNNILNTTDEDKIELAHQAGYLLAIAENTLYKVKENDFWQVCENDERYTAVYFREELDEFDEFVSVVEKLEWPVTVYVFTWGDEEFTEEFEHINGVKVKTIPLPILEIYKSIYNSG